MCRASAGIADPGGMEPWPVNTRLLHPIFNALLLRRSRMTLDRVLPALKRRCPATFVSDCETLARESTLHCGRALCMLLRLPLHPQERVVCHCDASISQLADDVRSDSGVIIVTGHFGHWELLVPFLTEYLRHVLVQRQVYVAYKPLHNKVLDCLLLRIRTIAARGLCRYIPVSKSFPALAQLRFCVAAALATAAPGALGFTAPVAGLASPSNNLLSSRAGRTGMRVRKSATLSLRAVGGDDPMRPREPGLSPLSGGGFSSKGEPPFQIRGFSLANFTLFAGLFITFYSFYQYFSNQNSLTSLGFVYGLPIALGGFALKYAEIKPVEVDTDARGDAIFEAKANEILKKVKADVTRHRYGDDAHLDSSLEKLGLVVEGKGFPQMLKITQREQQGELAFTMTFQSKDTPFKTWADPARIRRYETFFGGVNAEVIKVSKEERLVAIKLTTGQAVRGKGSMTADTAVSTGGGVKMESDTPERAPVKEDKKSMEV